MSSRLAQLLTLLEEGDENAKADIMREFPGFFKSRKMIEDFNKKKKKRWVASLINVELVKLLKVLAERNDTEKT